jgi:hypothetical protein
MESLNVFEPVAFDHTIHHKTIRSYSPYALNKLDKNDVIRILVQNQNGYTLPCESLLYIKGEIAHKDGTAVKDEDVVNNAFAFLFDEIRYYLNDVECAVIRNVGLTSLTKGLLSYNAHTITRLQNAGWLKPSDTKTALLKTKNFDVSVPMATLLGFFEDYQNILMNAKQELILIRSRTDDNSLKVSAMPEDVAKLPQITLHEVTLQMVHVKVSAEADAPLLKQMSDGASAQIPFRSWEMHERPNFPKSSPVTWAVKTSSQLDRPSYVIVFFQTGRNNVLLKNATRFDHCNVRSVKLYLNSEHWPYDSFSVDFAKGQVSQLYEMYARFQKSYYGHDAEPLLSRQDFTEQNPMWVIDCSNQMQPLKLGGIDIKLEISAAADFPDDTTAYCMIIHDKMIEMTPLTNQVTRIL